MPEKFNIVRQCRHGLMVFNRHDQFIGKALKVYGEYSEGCLLYTSTLPTNSRV